MKRILAVFDIDASYAERFADFANQKEQTPFTVIPFTSMEKLQAYSERNPVEILLVSSSIDRETLAGVKAGQIVTLSDGEAVPEDAAYPSIYKYQSADGIVREIMTCYCENPIEKALAVLARKAEVIGVYSPVNRCLKTSFSLALGQLLARDSKVLYLNLEEYSGLSALMNEDFKGSLSDILYFYQQKNFNWMRLSTVVYSWGSLDYIPPVCFPEDLDLIGGLEMTDLLTRIAVESPYEILVVDLGQFGKKALEVLEICRTVYMPIKEDCISAAKLEEFEDYVRAAGKPQILERIQKLKLPYHGGLDGKDNYVERLVWGELGDYIRSLLKGQVGRWES